MTGSLAHPSQHIPPVSARVVMIRVRLPSTPLRADGGGVGVGEHYGDRDPSTRACSGLRPGARGQQRSVPRRTGPWFQVGW